MLAWGCPFFVLTATVCLCAVPHDGCVGQKLGWPASCSVCFEKHMFLFGFGQKSSKHNVKTLKNIKMYQKHNTLCKSIKSIKIGIWPGRGVPRDLKITFLRLSNVFYTFFVFFNTCLCFYAVFYVFLARKGQHTM